MQSREARQAGSPWALCIQRLGLGVEGSSESWGTQLPGGPGSSRTGRAQCRDVLGRAQCRDVRNSG